MSREYTTRTDESGSYAVYSKNGISIEIPLAVHGDRIQDELDHALMSIALTKFKYSQVRDDVYVNGNLVRQDYSIETPEGAAILDKLIEAFPDYIDYRNSELNIIGEYDGYREPYQNPSISWYDCGGGKPSDDLQSFFNTSYPASSLKGWYGLKFDLTTKEVLFKPVLNDYSGDTPELPVGNTFYAVIHQQDGSSSDWVDAYVYATPKRIREFCADKGLAYPLDVNTHLECDVVWCWGFVFHKDTLEYGAVKAYARHNII